MISYREKEMMMVMKYIADHSDEFADQIMEAKDKMGAEENLNSLFNRLPDISDYAALVDYVKSCGYDTTLRINDLLSKEELNQLEKEYAEIENDFKEQTGLNKTDAIFVITAIILQMIRQFLQPSLDFDAFIDMKNRKSHNETADIEKENSYNKKKADKKKSKAENDTSKGSRYYYASVEEIGDIAHVPYDVISGTKNYNVKLNGMNHRVKTLGHDPWLGYLFGTCNILTNTMSLGKDNGFRTLHIRKDISGRPTAVAEASMSKMFEYAVKRYKESKATIGLAVIKQGYHIKSDEYSKEGLSLPFLQLFLDSDIIQELCECGIDYAKLDFIGTVSKQTIFAEVINYVISVAHRIAIVCEKNNKEDITKEELLQSLKESATLDEVRTRKIIVLSECIASAVNVIVIAGIEVGAARSENEKLMEEAAKRLDIGGYISTVIHLFSDIRFISKIKKDFVAKVIEENYQEKLLHI